MNIVYLVNMIHSLQDRRREATRARIVEAGLDRVADGGLEALSMHAVAAAVDLTPGALYRYFASKDDLLLAMELEVLDAWRARLAAAAGDAPTPLAGVVRATRAYLALAAEDPNRFALISHLLGDPRPRLDDERARALVPPLLGLLGLVAVPLGGLDRAVLLFASLHGLSQLRKLNRLAPAPLDAEGLADRLVDTLLLGFGFPPEAIAHARAA